MTIILSAVVIGIALFLAGYAVFHKPESRNYGWSKSGEFLYWRGKEA